MKIKGFGINGESLTDTSEKHYYAIIDVETQFSAVPVIIMDKIR